MVNDDKTPSLILSGCGSADIIRAWCKQQIRLGVCADDPQIIKAMEAATAIERKLLARELLDACWRIARTTVSWIEFSNMIFEPVNGLALIAFPTREEREWFAQTEEYKAIQKLVFEKMELR